MYFFGKSTKKRTLKEHAGMWPRCPRQGEARAEPMNSQGCQPPFLSNPPIQRMALPKPSPRVIRCKPG